MFQDSNAFAGFSVNDIEVATKFYGETLGFSVKANEMGILEVKFADGSHVIIYPKPNHEPATFTVLNILVKDIDKAAQDLKEKGVSFEHYEGMTGEDGIARGKEKNMGPDIAWFKDPAGNILSIIES